MAVILVTHGIPTDGLTALGEHTLRMPEPLRAFTKEELDRLIVDADAVIACGRVCADTIRRAARLKIIANYGAGYDGVDIAEAARCGVPVTNIPETVTDCTAELAFSLMLAVERRVGEMTLRMRLEQPEGLFGLGKWMGRSLQGQTLGIFGAGRIGGRLAEMARPFGMHVIGYSRRGCDPALAEPVGLDELLRRSDVLSLHCPLTAQTRGLFDRAMLARMKPGSVLINTSRGAVVDTDALCDALESGHLCGAGVDVYPDEPHVPERLLALPQAVLTPHCGSNTREARRIMAQACCAQVLQALAGERPANIVNGL